jgi:hypothetical protein
MAFRKEGAYAGIEDHIPSDKWPPPPIGLHKVKILKAIRFFGQDDDLPTTVVEMEILESENCPEAVGTICAWVRKLHPKYKGYYLAEVRSFVAASLGQPIAQVNNETAEVAINERESDEAGMSTGAEVYVMATPNAEKPQYPKIKFISA